MNPFMNIDKTLIVDADSICFIAAYNADKDTLPEEFFNGDREEEILRLGKEYGLTHIKSLLDSTGCESAELYFTSGRECFRYQVDPTYKANRKGKPAPVGINDIKKYLHSLYPGEICIAYEADDICVYRGKQNNTLLTAIDKDVIYQTVGTHYNYKKNEYITVTRKEADKFLWVQMIQGDTVDGIYGIEGMGKVKANKFLDEVKDYEKAVLELYKSKGKSKAEFMSNLNLLDMNLLQKDGSIRLRI